MDKNTTKLDKLLGQYTAPTLTKDYKSIFWAKAAQLPIQPKQRLIRKLSIVGSMLTVMFMIGVFLPKPVSNTSERSEIVQHIDELENFDIVNQMDLLDSMDVQEAS